MKMKRVTLFAAGKQSFLRDPRFLVGLVIIVASALLGAWIFNTSNRGLTFYEAARDLPAGSPVEEKDFVLVKGKLSNSAAYSSGEGIKLKGVLERSIRKGELLPANSIIFEGKALSAIVVQIENPLPSSAQVGDRVALWALPIEDPRTGNYSQPRLIASGLVIFTLKAGPERSLGGRQNAVEIGVPADKIRDVLSVMARKQPLTLVPGGE
ncbi:hypothetical protein KRX54_06645 [Actinomycetaceae bacterium TAE3-ERU4]|nr:hypothetical protein [Actinomycetaceae bacterium TAE3-ERU4]